MVNQQKTNTIWFHFMCNLKNKTQIQTNKTNKTYKHIECVGYYEGLGEGGYNTDGRRMI